MRTLQNFVGGAYRDAEAGPKSPLVNPSTGEPFAEAPVSGAADVDQAVAVAAEAFTSWRRTTPSERSLDSVSHRRRSRGPGRRIWSAPSVRTRGNPSS